jgi:hypothetical protein
MYTIVGLGSVGHNIVNKFLQYPQYNGYTIDCELPEEIGNSRFIELPECDHPEEYEKSVPRFVQKIQQHRGRIACSLYRAPRLSPERP